MKIVYLAAGAGGMYCGSCLHDNTLVAAILSAGEDALLVPTYTPLRTDEESVSQRELFFGGINVYLQQKLPLFRRTPRFFDRLLDSPALVSWAARRGAGTDPARLGDLTVSILRGEDGNQRKEVLRLVEWLAHVARPDVLHLSNAMLLGMIYDLRRRLDVPIVCSLSGEDIFLEKLAAPHYSQARDELRRRAENVAALVALNRYYADYMADYLDVEPARIRVVPHGLNLSGYAPHGRERNAGTVTIGYFARICPDKGLHVLAEAFEHLAGDPTLPPLRLVSAGYLGPADRPYLTRIKTRLAERGLADRFAYLGEMDRAAKINFLQGLDIMSVPTVYRESKGISILEAWAAGVPVVVPAHGAFPEMLADTGGGLLCEPENPRSLAEQLRRLIVESSLASACGARAQQAVRERYHAVQMARQTLSIYHAVLEARRGCPVTR